MYCTKILHSEVTLRLISHNVTQHNAKLKS